MSHPGHDAILPERPGDPVDPAYERKLQVRINDLLGCRFDGFPGAQSISFEASHFKLLETEDYFVCEKSDGVRYIMFANLSPKGYATFLLDRKNQIQFIKDLKLPLRDAPNKYHNETMMDGELVVDVDGDKRHLRFLVFDLMVINGNVITQRSLSTRLGVFMQDVYEPLKAALANDPELASKQPFTVEIKEMERSYGIQKVFQKIPHLKHANDGLIFTPVKIPYVSGTCPKLLKWKPVNNNTVDFKISVSWNKERKPSYQLWIAHEAIHEFYDYLTLEDERAIEWRNESPNCRIAEFWYDPNWKTVVYEEGYAPHTRAGGWRFVRFRDDKEIANDKAVFQRIWNSIQDAVSREMLERHCDIIRRGWKEREKNSGQRLSIPNATAVTPVHSRFPDTISPTTPSSAHSNHPPSLTSPSAGPSGTSGYFPSGRTPLERRVSSSSQVSVERLESRDRPENVEFDDQIGSSSSSSGESRKRHRSSSPEPTQERRPLSALLPTSQESPSLKRLAVSPSFQSSVQEISLDDIPLSEKILPSQENPHPVSSNTTTPPTYQQITPPQQNRNPSPQRRLTEIASILSPVVEESPLTELLDTQIPSASQTNESDSTTSLQETSTLQPDSSQPTSSIAETDDDEHQFLHASLSMENLPSHHYSSKQPLRQPPPPPPLPPSSSSSSQPETQAHHSPALSTNKPLDHFLPPPPPPPPQAQSTANESHAIPLSQTQAPSSSRPITPSDDVQNRHYASASPTEDEFNHNDAFGMEEVDNNTYNNGGDNRQTHIFINYSNNPLPASQQSQTRPPLSALQTAGFTGPSPGQHSVSASVSPETPTSITPSPLPPRPIPQKRKSKAMLEFILNDSESDQKRAKFEWE